MDLLDLRNKIDEIDGRIIPLLLERMEISGKVAEYKVKNGLPVLNEAREKEILDNVKKKCADQGDAVATVFAATMEASRELQHRIIGGGRDLREAVLAAFTKEKISSGAVSVACAKETRIRRQGFCFLIQKLNTAAALKMFLRR